MIAVRYATRLAWVVVCLALFILTGCSGRRSEQYTEQGNTYLRLGNVAAAVGAFQAALDADPANAQAKLGQARCLQLQSKSDEALAAYREALVLDPALDAAYVEGVRLVLTGQTAASEDATALADAYAAVNPEHGGILKSYVLREAGDSAGAIAVLDALRTQFPESMAVRVNLAATHLAAGNAPEAERILKEALDTLQPDSIVAQMGLIEAYQAQEKLPEIVAELRQLVQQRPEDSGLKLALAQSLLEGGTVDEAEAIARVVFEERPESPWANYVMGCCLLERGDFPEAVQCLELALRGLPGQPKIAEKLSLARRGQQVPDDSGVTAAVASGSVDGTEDWRSRWRAASFSDLLADRARVIAREPDAAETLTLAALFAGDPVALADLRAQLAGNSPVGDFLTAMEANDVETLRSVLDAWDETASDRKLLRKNAEGFAYARLGARGRAMNAFTECLRIWPDNGVALWNLASMYRGARMPQFAARCLQKLLVQYPRNVDARIALYYVLLEAQMTEEARRAAEATYAIFPGNAQVVANLARIYRQTGDSELSLVVMKEAVAADPDEPLLLLVLAETLLEQDDAVAAAPVLDKAAAQQADKGRVYYLQAFLAARQDRWDDVAAHCEAAGAGAPLSLRLLHAAALIRRGESQEAASRLVQADGTTPLRPAQTSVILEALDALPDGGPAVDSSLAGILESNPEALAGFAYGRACQAAGFYGPAFEAFAAVDDQVKGQSRVVALALSNLSRAATINDRQALAEAFTRKYPDMAAAWLGVAQVARALDDTDRERAALAKAAQVAPEDSGVLLMQASLYEKENNFEEALATYRRLAALDPDNPLMQNDLAYSILRVEGDPTEALALAEAAVEKLGANAHALHTLGLAQLRCRQYDDAEKSLATALNLRPGDPTLMLDYGQLLISQGNAGEGRNQVALALSNADALGLDFPRRAEAERIVE